MLQSANALSISHRGEFLTMRLSNLSTKFLLIFQDVLLLHVARITNIGALQQSPLLGRRDLRHRILCPWQEEAQQQGLILWRFTTDLSLIFYFFSFELTKEHNISYHPLQRCWSERAPPIGPYSSHINFLTVISNPNYGSTLYWHPLSIIKSSKTGTMRPGRSPAPDARSGDCAESVNFGLIQKVDLERVFLILIRKAPNHHQTFVEAS